MRLFGTVIQDTRFVDLYVGVGATSEFVLAANCMTHGRAGCASWAIGRQGALRQPDHQ
jgi:hypothetical protein